MEKIFDYVRNGKGKGFIFLLATAVLITIFWMFFIKQQYNEFRPQLLSAANNILPITVENGKIIDPINTYKKVEIKFSEDDKEAFPIVLDTRLENSEVPEAKAGLFLMTNEVYAISPSKIERLALKDGVWSTDKAEELLDYYVGGISLIISIVLIIVFFIGMLLKTLITAFIGRLIAKAQHKEEMLSFEVLMRLSALLIAAIEIIAFGCGFGLGFVISNLQRVLLALVVVWLFIARCQRIQ